MHVFLGYRDHHNVIGVIILSSRRSLLHVMLDLLTAYFRSNNHKRLHVILKMQWDSFIAPLLLLTSHIFSNKVSSHML